MKFNINNIVRIKLTRRGEEILRKQFNELAARYPASFGEYVLPKKDSRGFTEFQMWEVMNKFGQDTFNGSDLAFETTIEIPDEYLEKS